MSAFAETHVYSAVATGWRLNLYTANCHPVARPGRGNTHRWEASQATAVVHTQSTLELELGCP